MIDANSQTQKPKGPAALFFCVWFLLGCHNNQTRQASVGEGGPFGGNSVSGSDNAFGGDPVFGSNGTSLGSDSDGTSRGSDGIVSLSPLLEVSSPPRKRGASNGAFNKTGGVGPRLPGDDGPFRSDGAFGSDGVFRSGGASGGMHSHLRRQDNAFATTQGGVVKKNPCPECVSGSSGRGKSPLTPVLKPASPPVVWPSVKQLCPECLKKVHEDNRSFTQSLKIREGIHKQEGDLSVPFLSDFPGPHRRVLKEPHQGRVRPPSAPLVRGDGGFKSFHCLVRIHRPQGNYIRSIEFQPARHRARGRISHVRILDLNPHSGVEFVIAKRDFGFGFPNSGREGNLRWGERYSTYRFSQGRLIGQKIPFSEITKEDPEGFVHEVSYGETHLHARCAVQQVAYRLPKGVLVLESPSGEETKKVQCRRTRTRNPMVRREQIFYYENHLGHFPQDVKLPLRMRYSHPVDEYMGVVAYGNQKAGGGHGDYHCTELVHRFFSKVYQVPTRWGMGLGNGGDLAYNLVGFANRHPAVVWDPQVEAEARLRFAFFDNGCSSHLPLPGSAVSFEWQPYGHVAIVRKVQFLAEDVAWVWWFQQSTHSKNIGPHIVKDLFVKNEEGFWFASSVKGWITPLRLNVSPSPADLILVEESGHDGDQNG